MKKVLFASIIVAIFGASLNATVYATVNGQNITDQDIRVLLKSMPGATYEKLPPATQKKVVEQAVERKLLAQNAVKSGIENEAEFKKALKNIKSDLALELWMKKIFKNMNVTEKEIKVFFNKNADKFVKPSRAKARHILVKTQKEAQAIIDKLKNLKGDALAKKFIELAKAKSTGPSGKNGGELGWFNKRQMVKPFSNAAFALKKGTITMTPVKTQFGYHIIYLENKEIGKKATLAEVKPQIENSLKMDKFRKKVAAKAKDLRKGAKVIIK
ncbi:MAG: peptidylprolyl isomerase [Epsilonproteobacteria bacterium]|nr:peptidylprolyl isomerase [Campylobacterota bacterium]